MSDIEFKDFGKINRLRTIEMVISEKLDGTNAQICVPEDGGPVFIGSRNKWITPDDDNAGFARWATPHLESFRALGPGRHFGEWYGLGIQRCYELDHKRLAIFNVNRFPEGLPVVPENVHLVPVLYRGPFDTKVIAEVTEKLYRDGSVAVPGFKYPEGVIIEVTGGIRWKITDNGDLHKGATMTHKDVVMAAAEKNRLKRERDESAFAIALRTVTVTKLDTEPLQFNIMGVSLNGKVFGQICLQAEIGQARTAVAKLIEAENAKC